METSTEKFRNLIKTFRKGNLTYVWMCVCEHEHWVSVRFSWPCMLVRPSLCVLAWRAGSNFCWWQLASLSSSSDWHIGSVVFIYGESDTQWVAPSLALVHSLSPLISFGLVLNTHTTWHSGLLLWFTTAFVEHDCTLVASLCLIPLR